MAEGPAPILNAGSVIGNNPGPATGAVQSIAVNPAPGSQQIYVGTVSGGIWRTNNADPNNPGAVTWTPLTDQQASLSIGAIEFSPLDSNTIYAGTGSFSNLNWFAPFPTAIGILRTTDGGATWNNFAVNGANEGRIKAVVPTGVDLDPGPGVQEMILVAEIDGGGGVYRSDDNGQNFTPLSGANGLLAGAVSQLIVDPNNVNRYYAALPGQGVFRGDLGSVTPNVITWTPVNGPAGTGANLADLVGASANIQITAHDDGTNTTLYVGVANAVPANSITAPLTGVFRSTDAGANWNPLGTPANFNAFSVGGSGFNLIADGNPANNQVVYIAGLGNSQLFRNDGVANTWTQIAGAGFANNNSTPHADSRDMAFMGNNTLIEADDGGIYYLSTPTNANTAPGWRSFIGETTNGNALADVEIHSVAWDANSDIIIAGNQDNSNAVQQLTGSRLYTSVLGNDGGDVGVDTFTLAAANQSIRYFSSQNLGIFGTPVDVNGDFFRQVYAANNTTVGAPVEILPAAGLANFTAPFVTPIEINAIAPTAAQITAGQSTRIVVGGSGASPVYESNDAGTAPTPTWTAVNVPTSGPAIGTVTALAYGGRRAGVDNPDVLYVGDSNGNVFVRTTAPGTLTATQVTGMAFPGGQVTDIALDPNDWQHAFVTDASGVWETTNAGGNWIARTGNLSAIQAVTAGNNLIQTVEFCELGAVDCVLVGGRGGVFRMITNNPNVWSEYGQFMPNAITYDLDFVADDPDNNAANGTGVLIAGTFGRGAWEIQNASSTLTVPGVLQIFGDTDFVGENDTIRLVREASNASLLNVFLNGDFKQYELSTLQQINVFGLGGNDALIVDSSNGLINVVNGIQYNGGDGSDNLRLDQTGGPTRTSDTYSVGPDIGSGVSTIVGPGAGTQTVFFEDLEPVVDLVPALKLEVNATTTDNAISYSGLISGNGLVTIDEHESIEFANKTALTINAGAGQDTISVNNPNTPAGLAGITINGGNPSSGDTMIVTGAGRAVTVDTAAGTIDGATGTVLNPVSIGYSGIETLNLPAGIGDLTFTTTAADDTVVVTPGLTTGANSGTVSSSGAVPQIAFANSGTFTADLGDGDDALVVNGSSSADTVAVDGAAVVITNRRIVNYTGTEALTVNGNAGSDTFKVTPSALTTMFIDGGDPVGVPPGDLLNIIAGGQQVTFNAGPETDAGGFVVGTNEPVSFDHIESFGITGSGPAVINGTNGPDAITVIARDATTHPVGGVDGIQDFTVSVNTGPELLFVNVPSLTINALSGSDQVTLQTPAPNNAVWNVNVTVNGGPPAADTDRLIVQTPGTGAESVVYTPTASDGGTLDLQSLSFPFDSLVTINGIEALSYDGQADNDSLTIVGTGGADTIVHTPGANDQAGTFQVNSLLALSYQNLGSGAILTVDGAGGTGDTLVYNGTAANDTFSINGAGAIGGAGLVQLNSRLPVHTANVEALTLEGFAGDDTFTLVPAISASVYSTINLNGGEQASATGDRVYLVGTALADNINISGQVVTLGGRIINGSGIEAINLDALGGDDSITYNGVSGVTENITVSSSGVEGGGQISVPGVTLVNFKDVKWIDVNGNTPTPTETDTLTFAGTNAVDTFAINLAAAGTTADPILQLQNATGTTTLLTLRNYTNFNTLNVLGLDGTDTFNVTTAASTNPTFTGRNLFVDGGLPSGKKKSTDNLNVFYKSPRPAIIHSVATQNPDAGIVDLNYGTARFVVQYSDVEQVVIRKS